MGRIHLLEDAVINKIAAGEVVERPASVVKELVENAVDAGATQITVSLELGGARSIAVTDNGSGMAQDDAALALTRHATSKIRGADDLFQIQTMGFRGEALASIAAVSRLSLSTLQADAEAGVKLTVSGGEGPMTLPWNGAIGTTVAVENLFYNLPVRAKFLKAPATEFSHCLELVQAFALCHPSVGFTLLHNGREHFRVGPVVAEGAPWLGETALRERARAVVGKDAASLIYVRSSSRFGDFEALISPPGLERPTTKQLFTFVNGRWVKDKTMRYGILRGYHSHILKGKYPIAVAHLTMDPTLVDVNVHPAKTELRFQYASEVQNLLALAIRERLRSGEWAVAPGVPDFSRNHIPSRPVAPTTRDFDDMPRGGAGSAASSSTLSSSTLSSSSVSMTRRSFNGASQRPASNWSARPIVDKAGLDAMLASDQGDAGDRSLTRDTASLMPDMAMGLLPFAGESLAAEHGATPVGEAVPWDELVYLGAYDKCFLLFEAKGRLLVLDQHAFHERVLYERLVRDDSLLSQSQGLLVPESLELSPSDVATLRGRRPALVQRGFDFLVDSDTTITVRGVPTILARRNLVDLFADLARDPQESQDVLEGGGDEPIDSNAEMARLILAGIACHAAVRAGEELPEGELKQLLATAKTVDFYHNCPHGRRVLRWWSRDQVARWFDR